MKKKRRRDGEEHKKKKKKNRRRIEDQFNKVRGLTHSQAATLSQVVIDLM